MIAKGERYENVRGSSLCSASSNAQMKACSVAHEQTGLTHVHTHGMSAGSKFDDIRILTQTPDSSTNFTSLYDHGPALYPYELLSSSIRDRPTAAHIPRYQISHPLNMFFHIRCITKQNA